MFVLPTLILPLVFGLAIFRLYQIPKKLLSKELQLPPPDRPLLLASTILAYFLLLIYTILLIAFLIKAILTEANSSSEYFSLFIYIAAYPFSYMGVAWIFYYGLRDHS